MSDLKPTSDHAALLTNLGGVLHYLPDVLRDLENAHERCEALRIRLDMLEDALHRRISDVSMDLTNSRTVMDSQLNYLSERIHKRASVVEALALRIDELDRENSKFDGSLNARLQSVESRLEAVEARLSAVAENHVSRLCDLERSFDDLTRRFNALTSADPFSYDWNAIDARYQYAATDGDGTHSYFAQEPHPGPDDFFWFKADADPVPPYRTSPRIPEDASRCPNWRDSLRNRPAPVPVQVPVPPPIVERRRGDADFVVSGERYLTGDHDVVGPMEIGTCASFPDQLQGPCNGDADTLYYFLPNGNHFPDSHKDADSYNSYEWNHVIRRLEGYRDDHPRDPQFAPGALKGEAYTPLEGKTFRLTGEFRVPRPGEFYVSGGADYAASPWHLSEHNFQKPIVLDFDHYSPSGGPRLIAVEYPVKS